MNEAKLIINFIIDNSSSLKGDKIIKLKNALQKFDENLSLMSLSKRVEYSITLCEGFNSKIYKKFDEKLNLNQLYVGGVPFLNDAIKNSIKNLLQKIERLEKSSIQLYKPWTVLLVNGENYDDLEESSELILSLMKNGKMSYFPFALTDCEFDKSFACIRRIKSFTIIKDEKYDELFNWVLEMTKMRLEKPKNEPISINLNSFEGWTLK